MTGKSILSGITYHDYCALICYLDSEWALRTGYSGADNAELHLRVARDFTEVCLRYWQRVDGSRLGFYRENGQETEQKGLDQFLFNPACCISFGHADDVAVVLTDGFDPMISITGDIKSSVEQACLAFCPTLDSLGPELRDQMPFTELHTLLCGPRPHPKEKGNETYSPSNHPFLRTHPLWVLTKYKLGSLAVLSQGLLIQQALLRTMARKICDVLGTLRQSMPRPEVRNLMNEADIDSLRCVFLDPQAPEEMATLMVCRNYSVAMALVAALRTLTFGDIFDREEQIEDRLRTPRMHRSFLYASRKLAGKTPSSDIGLLRDNHVFCSTYTTLGVSHAAFLNSEHANCNGLVDAYMHADIEPGHHGSTDEHFLKAFEKSCTEAEAPKGTVALGNIDQFHRFLVGRHDRTKVCSVDAQKEQLVGLPTGIFLSLVKDVLDTFGRRQEKGDHGRDLLDISTSLNIPIPRLIASPKTSARDLILGKIGREHTPLSPLLDHMGCRLFGRSSDTCKSKNSPPVARGRLDIHILQDKLRQIGAPYSIRRTILYLFQVFANCLADPFLFDGVLDLYDTFVALHSLIAGDLAREHELLDTEDEKRTFFDEKKVDELSSLVETLQNALMHRVHMALPDAEMRDMAVDFRGGLNQLVAAADVPIKCGLGLVRWVMEKYQPDDYGTRDSRQADSGSLKYQVAAVARITFDPRPTCHRLELGQLQHMRLADLQMNVTHLLDPANFMDFLHEALHLIFDYLCVQGHLGSWAQGSVSSDGKKGNGCPSWHPTMTERLAEIFAAILSHLLVFGSDADLFLRHYISHYTRNPKSIGSAEGEVEQRESGVLLRFTEVLIRAFLVTDPIRAMLREHGSDPLRWSDVYPLSNGSTALSDNALEVAERRFTGMVEKVGPFFSEFHRLWHGPNRAAVRAYCVGQFREILSLSSPEMIDIWRHAVNIYKQYAASEFPCEIESGYDDRGALKYDIGQGLSNGKPLIRNLYLNQRFARGDTKDPEKRGLDSLYLVCEIIYQHLHHLYGSFDTTKGIHLYRRPKDGRVDYQAPRDDGTKGWNDFQIDRGLGTMFCAHPGRRRGRLLQQIVVIKTLWDVSTNLRARRAWDILRDSWPGLEKAIAEYEAS